MNNRIKMQPFVSLQERSRFYALLALRIKIEDFDIDYCLHDLKNDFINIHNELTKTMAENLSLSNDKNGSFVEALNSFECKDVDLYALYVDVFNPLTAEEQVVLKSIGILTPISTIIMALEELSKMIKSL